MSTELIDVIAKFVKDDKNVLYTMVNMTRKAVGVGTSFNRGEEGAGAHVVFRLACDNVSREHKLTGSLAIIPDMVTSISEVDGHTLLLKQLRYLGAQKCDSIAVFKAPNENVNLVIK